MSRCPQPPLLWGVGIEDTSIGWPLEASPTGLDEYDLTEHYARWRDDLRLAASINAKVVRYGFPWYRIEPSQGVFDWSFPDGVVAEAQRLGIDLVVDLVHYGTPRWLTGSFLDDDYPEAVADWARGVASRYKSDIRYITPLNEPLVTASFVGERGIWPPHHIGDNGWARVVVALADGLQRSIHAIRAAAPDMTIVHVEASQIWAEPVDGGTETAQLVQLQRAKSWLPTDLLVGGVDQGHALYDWLLEHGVKAAVLDRLAATGVVPDWIGVNYYPELSARELTRFEDRVIQVTYNAWDEGLEQTVTGFLSRYGLPVLLSETSVEGPDDHRREWLLAASSCLERLRDAGADVVGMVWWPLFDFVDWSWATGDRVIEEFFVRDQQQITAVVPPKAGSPMEEFLRRMGLMRLVSRESGLERVPTPVSALFKNLAFNLDPQGH